MKHVAAFMQGFHEVVAWPGAAWVRLQVACARWWSRAEEDPVTLRRLWLGALVVFWVGVFLLVRWWLR